MAAKNTARNNEIRRFGTLTKVEKRTVRSGKNAGSQYLHVEMDCNGRFTQVATCFSKPVMERLIALGEGVKTTMKIVEKDVKVSNGNGGTITEKRATVVFVVPAKTAEAADGEAADETAGEGAEADADAGADTGVDEGLPAGGIDDEIPF